MIEMELRHLRYFLAIAECHSFTRASARLHVTQPTLSHQIKQLEALLGSALFDRVGHNVDLTEAGKLFLPYCERTLRELDSGRLACSELEGLIRGALQMGVFLSFSNSVLPPILSEFAVRYPGVHVVARIVPRSEMQQALISGHLDMAIAYVFENAEQIVAEPLFDDELVVVVGAGHPKAAKQTLPMKELGAMPLVMLTPEFGARQFVDQFFAEFKIHPRIMVEMNMIEPILSILRNSSLATVISAGAVADKKGLRVIRLTDPVPKRSVGILWRRQGHRSAAAQRMGDMIKAAYQQKMAVGRRQDAHSEDR